MMPRDEHEFLVLMRKEYERGVQTALNEAQETYGLSSTGVEDISNAILSRATSFHREFPLMSEMGETLNQCPGISLTKSEDKIWVTVGEFLVKPSFVASPCDSIFKVHSELEWCRTQYKRRF